MLKKALYLALLTAVVLAAPVQIQREKSLRERNEHHDNSMPPHLDVGVVTTRDDDVVDGTGQWKRDERHDDFDELGGLSTKHSNVVDGSGQWKRATVEGGIQEIEDDVKGGGQWKRDDGDVDGTGHC